MTEYTLFETLKEAFESSTPSNNYFKETIERVKWDDCFYADEEYYFIKGGFLLTTPSLNPFEINHYWMPSVLFSDYSQISF